MKWQKKLTKKELKHMKENNCGTLKAFAWLRSCQREHRIDAIEKGFSPGIAEPCFECKHIAMKLGIE